MIPRKATIADASILTHHGAYLEDSCLHFKNWKFLSTHERIADESQLIALAKSISMHLGIVPRDDEKIALRNDTMLRLPSMIFISDVLEISTIIPEDRSELKFCFSAQDILSTWASKQFESKVSEPHSKEVTVLINDSKNVENSTFDTVLKVPYALQWEGAKDAEFKTLKSDWDWTWCSDYCFTLDKTDYIIKNRECGVIDAGSGSNKKIITARKMTQDSRGVEGELGTNRTIVSCELERIERAVVQNEGNDVNVNVDDFDVNGDSVNAINEDVDAQVGKKEDKEGKNDMSRTNEHNPRRLNTAANEEGIDVSLLQQREDILFYDELILYQASYV